jgi:hypothetical protein
VRDGRAGQGGDEGQQPGVGEQVQDGRLRSPCRDAPLDRRREPGRVRELLRVQADAARCRRPELDADAGHGLDDPGLGRIGRARPASSAIEEEVGRAPGSGGPPPIGRRGVGPVDEPRAQPIEASAVAGVDEDDGIVRDGRWIRADWHIGMIADSSVRFPGRDSNPPLHR